jgi:hypothetical protein
MQAGTSRFRCRTPHSTDYTCSQWYGRSKDKPNLSGCKLCRLQKGKTPLTALAESPFAALCLLKSRHKWPSYVSAHAVQAQLTADCSRTRTLCREDKYVCDFEKQRHQVVCCQGGLCCLTLTPWVCRMEAHTLQCLCTAHLMLSSLYMHTASSCNSACATYELTGQRSIDLLHLPEQLC